MCSSTAKHGFNGKLNARVQKLLPALRYRTHGVAVAQGSSTRAPVPRLELRAAPVMTRCPAYIMGVY